MDMGVRNRNQSASERTWTVVDFFTVCVLDFLYAGDLQRRIGRFAIARFLCRYTYIVRGKEATECPKGDFLACASYEVVVR